MCRHVGGDRVVAYLDHLLVGRRRPSSRLLQLGSTSGTAGIFASQPHGKKAVALCAPRCPPVGEPQPARGSGHGRAPVERLAQQVEHVGRPADVTAFDLDQSRIDLTSASARSARRQVNACLRSENDVAVVCWRRRRTRGAVLVRVADDRDAAERLGCVRVDPADDVGERPLVGDERCERVVQAPVMLGDVVEAVGVFPMMKTRCGGTAGPRSLPARRASASAPSRTAGPSS